MGRKPKSDGITVSAAKRMLKDNGAIRVSDKAARDFKSKLDNYGMNLASNASRRAHLNGRKTVKTKDFV